MRITSTAFANMESIPARFTCDDRNVSPPLAFESLPAGAKSLALIVDDPDAPDPSAPRRTWVHWVLYDVPASASGLAEAVAPAKLPAGTKEGKNDWGRTGWGGPCPPIGRHRYFFKLYALDSELGDLGAPAKADLEKAMKGHVIGSAQIVGTYQKRG
jgi:Raf kinase inhibitor-like YbhB/YbcL family protein